MKLWTVTIAGILGTYVSLVLSDAYLFPVHTSYTDIMIANSYLEEEGLPQPPRTFYHDGCTSAPDFLLWHDFTQACFTHDVAYWAGGSLQRKNQVDLQFRDDIAATGILGPVFAFVMYNVVHHFGDNISSRIRGSNWGYGWNE